MMVRTLSGENDSDDFRKELVEKALRESLQKIRDCLGCIKNERWRSANSELYYALYHAAKAVLFIRGKDPTSHNGTKTELGKVARENAFDKTYLRFYGDRERLRSMTSYTYVGEVEDFDREDMSEALSEALPWLEQTVDELIVPLIPSVGSFDVALKKAGLGREDFDLDRNWGIQEEVARNTCIDYMYRKGLVLNKWARVVLEGEISRTDIEMIEEALPDGVFFIPEVVGFPSLIPDDVDFNKGGDVWHEILSVRSTNEEPNKMMKSAVEVCGILKSTTEGQWEDAASAQRAKLLGHGFGDDRA